MRPPGLWAAIVVLGVEFLRNREADSRDLPFLVEWGTVALLMLAMTLANGFVLPHSHGGPADAGLDASPADRNDIGLSARGCPDRLRLRAQTRGAGGGRRHGTPPVKRLSEGHRGQRTPDRSRRRALVVGGVQLAFMGALGLRMRQLQVEEAERVPPAGRGEPHQHAADPARARARSSTATASSSPTTRRTTASSSSGRTRATWTRRWPSCAADHAGRDELERALREIERRSPFVPVTLADRLSWEDFSRVAVNAPALPGITTEVGLSRLYPLGARLRPCGGLCRAGQRLRPVQARGSGPSVRRSRSSRSARSGVEAGSRTTLRGKAGTRRIEVNAAGRVMRELDRDEGIPGADMQLTIDHRLQNYVQARLSGRKRRPWWSWTSRPAISLAIASAPAFDPNLFVRGISVADYRALTEDNHRPLADKTVQGTYPPGSTFKMVTALAALEAGVIGPDETVWCPGHYEAGRPPLPLLEARRARRHGPARIASWTAATSITTTSPSASAIDRISAMANGSASGLRHDLPMSAVAEGLAPTRPGRRARRGEDWLIGDTLNSAHRSGLRADLAAAAGGDDGAAGDGAGGAAAAVKSIGRGRGARRARARTALRQASGILRSSTRRCHDTVNDRRGTA